MRERFFFKTPNNIFLKDVLVLLFCRILFKSGKKNLIGKHLHIR